MAGGGFGALDSMNKAIKNNRALQKRRKGFEILKDNFTWKQKKTKYKFKKATEAQLFEIRNRMKRLFWVNILKGAIALAVSAAIIYLSLQYAIAQILER